MRIRKRHFRLGVVAGLAMLTIAFAGIRLATFIGMPPDTNCSAPSGVPSRSVCHPDECTNIWEYHPQTKLVVGYWELVNRICPEPGPSPILQPLSDDPNDQPEMTIPNPGGQLPCGLGIVERWGHSVFDLSYYPGCASYMPNLTVYCLDESGNWTNAYVRDVTASTENNTVAFQAKQHGICGLFPTE